MAGSLTVSYRDLKDGSRARKVTVDWISDASTGAVSGATTVNDIRGFIQAIVTNPSAGGVQPDDSYDILINDTDGIDIAGGLLANRDETNTERVVPFETTGALTDEKRYVDSVLDIVIAAAGNSNQGAIDIYWISV